MNAALIDTPLGKFRAQFTERGLARLQFPKTAADPIDDSIEPPKNWLRQATAALKTMLAGHAPKTLPPLDLSTGTAFQQQTWRAMLRIPAGRTRGYGELARAVRRPKAARAIGGACGANPIPVLIPCHRVIGASGSLTGFSGGMHWKVKLLEIERVKLPLH
ncbi:MAG TPA: methylated-DNA--[protein]-cysteine S-methyltransferase [Verrucomicrobiales bacterium]|nr:methylated-DNA--[protein]-cysteine S-methyltransferase [Verrucomicrobiales bacterium]